MSKTKVYLVRTTTKNEDGSTTSIVNGIFSSPDKAVNAAEELSGRNEVLRHNVATSEPRICITETEVDTLYENL